MHSSSLYTVYRIVRIFLEAPLHQTSVDSSQAWFWVGMTLASIAAGILLSIAGSVICHDCAFRALYDLRMRILGHMGKLNLGFFHRRAVRCGAEDHERQH